MRISNKLYDTLKWIAQILLPGLGTLYVTVAALWGLPAAEEVVGTIVALDLFLGGLLGISSNAFQKAQPIRSEGYDGMILRHDTEDKTLYSFVLDGEPEEVLANKDEVTLKVKDGLGEEPPPG